jgi:hypothetical protein
MGLIVFAFASGTLSGLGGSFAGLASGAANADAGNFAVEQAAFTYPGQSASSPPILDGTSTNQVYGGSSSIGATLTTTRANDVVVAYVSPADTGATAPPSVSGISGGGLTWNHRVTTATVTYSGNSYVPITITNSQTSATPTAFQQMVTWNPSTYSSYEASNLGNIRFCAEAGCATNLYAWLESCTSSCAPTATSATAWVQLSSVIAGSGGQLTIYMVFAPTSTNFDGNYWGEAPTLSGAYAQYDNGANVFTAYFDGNTPTSDFTVGSGLAVSQAPSVAGPGATTIDAIQVTGSAAAHEPHFAFDEAMSNSGLITESSFAQVTDFADASPITGLVDSATASSVANGISVGAGAATTYFFQMYDSAGTVSAFVNELGASVAAETWLYGSVTYPGTSATSWSATVAPQLYSSTGGQTDTYANNPLSGVTGSLYLGAMAGTSAVQVYFNWDRARAYPPGGVMPSTSLGGVTTPTSTFDTEEWYAIASSTITSTTMTATFSAPDTAATWIAVFGVSGANTVSPFDACSGCASGASPQTASGASNVQTTMSTSYAYDLLLYGCAAGGGGLAAGFTGIYSNSYPPDQNEYAGYETVSVAQTNLVTSCGGTSTYGTEITDAVAGSGPSTSPGASVYVRNVGTVPLTLVSVYVVDQSTGTFVMQAAINQAVSVGVLVDIPQTTIAFTPSSGNTYSFTVTSSSGNSVTFDEEAS